jgi:hypothetical protein
MAVFLWRYLAPGQHQPPLAPATITFLSTNPKMPDTVQPIDHLPEDKVVIENPIIRELKVYDRGDEPWQSKLTQENN